MSRKADCWGNAVAEPFFSHLGARVIEGRSFRDERELRRVVFEYIEIHYARERKHSSNGWKTPQQCSSSDLSFQSNPPVILT